MCHRGMAYTVTSVCEDILCDRLILEHLLHLVPTRTRQFFRAGLHKPPKLHAVNHRQRREARSRYAETGTDITWRDRHVCQRLFHGFERTVRQGPAPRASRRSCTLPTLWFTHSLQGDQDSNPGVATAGCPAAACMSSCATECRGVDDAWEERREEGGGRRIGD